MKRNSGFTLVEVIATLAVISIGVLGTTQLLEGLNKSEKSTNYTTEFDSTVSEIQSVISGSNCKAKLGLITLTATNQKVSLNYLPPTFRLLKINSVYLNDLTLAQTTTTNQIITASINININRFGSSQVQDQIMAVLYIQTDNTNNVTLCSNTPIAI
jgi:prepilin-type N-terminal cleavage/methylation domain-containing protein